LFDAISNRNGTGAIQTENIRQKAFLKTALKVPLPFLGEGFGVRVKSDMLLGSLCTSEIVAILIAFRQQGTFLRLQKLFVNVYEAEVPLDWGCAIPEETHLPEFRI